MTDPGNGNQNQDQTGLGWRAALPDEYKEHEFVKTFQKPGDFVKSAIEIKTERDTLKGKLDNAIPKLPENATDADRENYFLATGRPERPEQYEFDGDNNDEAMLNFARNAFFKHGISKDAGKGIVADWNEFIAQSIEEQKTKLAEDTAAAKVNLQKELGDKFDEKVELARRFMKETLGEETYTLFETVKVGDVTLGNHPVLTRVFLKFAEMSGEDKTSRGSSPGDNQGDPDRFSYPNSPKYPKRNV